MKKTMKWITLSLSAAALLGLTACGAKPAPPPAATPEPTRAPAVQPAELNDLEGILTAMEEDTKATIAYLTSESERLKAEIGGDYQTYKAKQKDINRWLELVDTETASYVQRTQEGCKRYFTLLPDKVEHLFSFHLLLRSCHTAGPLFSVLWVRTRAVDDVIAFGQQEEPSTVGTAAGNVPGL